MPGQLSGDSPAMAGWELSAWWHSRPGEGVSRDSCPCEACAKGWQEAGLSEKGPQPNNFGDASTLPADGE